MSRLPRPKFAISPAVGAALALLALGLIAPGSALAACGHDPGSDRVGADHFEFLRASGAIDAPPAPEQPGQRPGGCSGPSCSRKSGLPSVPPSSLGSPRSTQWALVEPLTPPPSPGLSRRPGDECDTSPVDAPGAVFHPPRRAPLVG